MNLSPVKLGLLFGAVVLQGCAANSVSNIYGQAKAYTNKATSALNNQTYNVESGIKFDDATGLPSYVSDKDGNAACDNSGDLKKEVENILATKQSQAVLIAAHEEFKSETQQCAQYKAHKLGEDFGCAIINGNVVVKSSLTEPASPKECSTENISLRHTEILKGAYLPEGKYANKHGYGL